MRFMPASRSVTIRIFAASPSRSPEAAGARSSSPLHMRQGRTECVPRCRSTRLAWRAPICSSSHQTCKNIKAVSREIFAILGKRGQPVEGLSLDEAFVALGETTLEEARALAATLRGEIFDTTGLTVSAGVATGKMIAKIASDTCKPDGLLAIAPGEEGPFLEPLPVARLWGVGPKMQTRLSVFGITTVGELAALDEARLRGLFGSWWREVSDLARGIDRRPVETARETKSISTEETFEYDVCDESRLIDVLRAQARELAETLERARSVAQTVGIKIKRSDFTVLGRQTHLAEPTRDGRRIFRAAVHCLRRAALEGAPVRLLGTRVASLIEGDSLQTSLFN